MDERVTSVGVFTTDGELVVTSWDPWLAEASGVPATRACGTPLLELFPDIGARGFTPRLRRVVEQGAVEVLAPAFHRYFVPCRPLRPSAHFEQMQQHVTLSPLRADGAITGVVVTIEDVTVRLERERELAAELRHHDEAIRVRAARALAGEEPPVQTLATALGDTSWRVRREVVRGMANVGGDEAVATLIEAVRERHRDPATLNAAISALSQSSGAVPGVIELLRLPDADVRIYAALTLGQMEDPAAVPALVDALGDADVNVRYHAIEALGRIGSRAAAEPLALVAASRDFYLAFPALDALAAIGEPSVAQHLVPLLEDELLQAAAATALGELANEDVATPLARLLGQEGAAVAAIAGALTRLAERLEQSFGEGGLVEELARRHAGTQAAHALLGALGSAADGELRGLVTTLGWLDAEGIDVALARMLAHPIVRTTVSEIIAMRGARAVDALVDALRHDDEPVRQSAAAVLGRIADPRAVPALVRLLEDPPEVAIVAAGALGAIGDPAAFEPLLALLDHDRAALRQAAVAALSSLGHPDLAARIAPMTSHASPGVRESAARIAAYFAYDECLDQVLALARDPVESVRRAAVENLALFDADAATGAIADALRTDTPEVRAAAARGLARVQSSAAVSLLLAAVADADLWVRYHAATAAAHHRDARLRDALVRSARQDPVPPVRLAAIQSLAALWAEEAAPVLMELADDVDLELSSAAISALGRVPGDTADARLAMALRSGAVEQRMAALDAAAGRASGALVPELLRAARTDDDARVRDGAIQVLGVTQGDAAVEALLSLLDHPRRVRAVVDALANGDEHRVGALARGLALPDVAARCAVVEALARMKHPSASRRLTRALEDGSAAVRLAAAQALGRLDLREAEDMLREVARADADPAVRRAAHGALQR